MGTRDDDDIDDDKELDEDELDESEEGKEEDAEESDESDDEKDSESEEESDEDKEEVDAKRSNRAQQRRERKEYRKQKEREAYEKIALLENQLKKTNEYIQEFAGKISERVDSRDLNEIDTRLAAANQRYQEASKYIEMSPSQLQRAYETGDAEVIGTTFANMEKARDIKMQAAADYNALKALKDRFHAAKSEEKEETVQTQSNVDGVKEGRLRSEWISKNSWFDTKASDRDSKVALQINAEIVSEGYKPDTPAFWSELSRRIKEELPHKYKAPAKKPPHQMVGSKEASVSQKSATEPKIPPEFRKILNETYGHDKNNPERKKAVSYYLSQLKSEKR